MSLGREMKRRVRDALPPLFFAALCGYFAWHSVHGNYGLMAREAKLQDIAQARAVLARAEGERDAMERRIAGLRGERIDRDQLDERADAAEPRRQGRACHPLRAGQAAVLGGGNAWGRALQGGGGPVHEAGRPAFDPAAAQAPPILVHGTRAPP